MKLSTFEAFKTVSAGALGITVEGETLEKCQELLLHMAEDFIGLCEEENIWYQLSGGTALGAFRHHGFIPWDDDIDINVLEKDLETLKQKLAERFGDKYTFLDWRTPGFWLPMKRVMLNGSVYCDRESYGSDYRGFYLDLFPVVNVPDNRFLRKLHGTACMVAGGLLSCRKFFWNRRLLLGLAEENPEIKSAVWTKVLIGGLISFLPLSACAGFTTRIYRLCKNDNSKYVSIPSGRKHYFGEMYLRDEFVNTRPCLFEGHEWQIAAGIKAYMTALYGPDYMTPPPEEKREKHVLFELVFPKEENTI